MPVKLKTLLYNLGYFFREVKTSIRLNSLINLFSTISIGLMLFILGMVISGWWMSNHLIEVISQEAEINVFWDENLPESEIIRLSEQVEQLDGVRLVRIVSEQEAYDRMAEILGNEAKVLEVFDSNPFSPYMEINIDLDKTGAILDRLNRLSGVEYVRDNQEVLDRLQGMVRLLGVLGYLGLTAVAITTLIIVSHIIKLSIHSRKNEIYTLEILGASKGFIAFPFLVEGITIALMGSLLATSLIVPAIKLFYMQVLELLPFLPLPSPGELVLKLIGLIGGISISFGLIGSIVGLSSTKV